MAVEVYKEVHGKKLEEYIAYLPGVRAKLKATAQAGAARAEAILAAHHHSGDARITVTHGQLDYYVNLDDSRGQRAAAAIEFGRSGGNRGATQGIHAITGAF